MGRTPWDGLLSKDFIGRTPWEGLKWKNTMERTLWEGLYGVNVGEQENRKAGSPHCSPHPGIRAEVFKTKTDLTFPIVPRK